MKVLIFEKNMLSYKIWSKTSEQKQRKKEKSKKNRKMQCKNTQDNAVYVEDLIKTSMVAGTFYF